MSVLMTAAATIVLAAFIVVPAATGSAEEGCVLDGEDSGNRDWDVTRETAPGLAENRNRP